MPANNSKSSRRVIPDLFAQLLDCKGWKVQSTIICHQFRAFHRSTVPNRWTSPAFKLRTRRLKQQIEVRRKIGAKYVCVRNVNELIIKEGVYVWHPRWDLLKRVIFVVGLIRTLNITNLVVVSGIVVVMWRGGARGGSRVGGGGRRTVWGLQTVVW